MRIAWVCPRWLLLRTKQICQTAKVCPMFPLAEYSAVVHQYHYFMVRFWPTLGQIDCYGLVPLNNGFQVVVFTYPMVHHCDMEERMAQEVMDVCVNACEKHWVNWSNSQMVCRNNSIESMKWSCYIYNQFTKTIFAVRQAYQGGTRLQV